MTYFRHRYPPVHIVRKQTDNAQKIVAKSQIARAFWSISFIYCGAGNISRPLARYEAFSFTFYGFMGDSKIDRN